MNSSYHHYYHHAHGTANAPLYTGFFLKAWDQILGTVNKGPCMCTQCEVGRGKRSKEAFEKVVKPDYSVLLTLSFWTKWSQAE